MRRIIRKVFNNAKLAFVLGDGWKEKVNLLQASFLFPLEHKLHKKRTDPLLLNLKFSGKQFSFSVLDSADLAVLREVFLEEEYKLDLAHNPKCIVDLGSNIGASVIYFALKYPNARIWAIEADPNTAAMLAKNMEPFPLVTVKNYAITDSDGTALFYVHPESRISSSLAERVAGQVGIEVPARTFESVLREEHIEHVDLLKFDIEGGEYAAFKNPSSLEKVAHLVGEVHLDLVGVSEGSLWSCFKKFTLQKSPLSAKRFLIQGENSHA